MYCTVSLPAKASLGLTRLFNQITSNLTSLLICCLPSQVQILSLYFIPPRPPFPQKPQSEIKHGQIHNSHTTEIHLNRVQAQSKQAPSSFGWKQATW